MYVKIEVPKEVVKRVNKAADRCQVIAEWLQSQCDTEVSIADQITEHNEGKQRKKRFGKARC